MKCTLCILIQSPHESVQVIYSMSIMQDLPFREVSQDESPLLAQRAVVIDRNGTGQGWLVAVAVAEGASDWTRSVISDFSLISWLQIVVQAESEKPAQHRAIGNGNYYSAVISAETHTLSHLDKLWLRLQATRTTRQSNTSLLLLPIRLDDCVFSRHNHELASTKITHTLKHTVRMLETDDVICSGSKIIFEFDYWENILPLFVPDDCLDSLALLVFLTPTLNVTITLTYHLWQLWWKR